MLMHGVPGAYKNSWYVSELSLVTKTDDQKSLFLQKPLLDESERTKASHFPLPPSHLPSSPPSTISTVAMKTYQNLNGANVLRQFGTDPFNYRVEDVEGRPAFTMYARLTSSTLIKSLTYTSRTEVRNSLFA